MNQIEFILSLLVFVMMSLGYFITSDDRNVDNHIGASLIQGHRIERCGDTQIGDDGGIVLILEVAFRRYVHDKTNMEMRLVC